MRFFLNANPRICELLSMQRIFLGFGNVFVWSHRAIHPYTQGRGEPHKRLQLGCSKRQPCESPQSHIKHQMDPGSIPQRGLPGSKLDVAVWGWTARGRPCQSRQAPMKAGDFFFVWIQEGNAAGWWCQWHSFDKEGPISECRLGGVGSADGSGMAQRMRNFWGVRMPHERAEF